MATMTTCFISTATQAHTEDEHYLEHNPVVDEEVIVEVITEVCSVSDSQLRVAKTEFASQCPSATERDCDPIDGQWVCSSERIGASGGGTLPNDTVIDVVVDDDTVVVDDDTVVVDDDTVVIVPISGDNRAEAESVALSSGWESTADGIYWGGSNRYNLASREDDSNMAYTLTLDVAGTYEFEMSSRVTPDVQDEPPNDVWVTFGDTGWVKAYIGQSKTTLGEHDITGEHGGEKNKEIIQAELSAGQHVLTISGRSRGFEIDWVGLKLIEETTTPGDSLPEIPELLSSTEYEDTINDSWVEGDLVSLHWDSSMDPDDMQAMIASRIMLDGRSEVDYLAVNGTKTDQHDGILSGSTDHMLTLFPEGYDADANSVEGLVASEWQIVLNTGMRVHVAEGGPSDFTSRVIDIMVERGVSTEALKRVRVIQHSWGWNETNTDDDNLDTVTRYADYIRIGDGNQDTNHNANTSDFNSGTTDSDFRTRALASVYSDEWQTAFDRINDKVDFSDAVEVMWILGYPKEHAATPEEFANRYF